MLYPAYIHLGDEQHAHGVTLPDFPGCFSAVDNWEALPGAIQEAVEVYFEGEEGEIPAPTPLEILAQNPGYSGGVWMLVDVDLTAINTKPVRLNISLPAHLVNRIDRYAETHHLTRSGFLARAAEREMAR